MLTLEKARKLQKERQGKIILKFAICTAIVLAISYFLFFATDMLSRNSVYYLVPIALMIVIIYKTEFSSLFAKKEFIGTVIKIEIYSAEERKVKKGGFGALQDYFLEAELIVKNEDGKTLLKVFRNGDTTSRLAEGDEVAIMRLIDEPVVIKGAYWKTK